MDSVSDRRTLLRLAVAVTLAPALATRAAAAPQAGGRRFAPAQGTMTFTRLLVRHLSDGNQLAVNRSFAIRFAPRPSGWSVTGEQVAVSVDFPQRLAALASVEQQRRETGLFPLLLDSAGMIVDGPEARPAKRLDEAVAAVMRGLDKTGYAAGDRKQFDAFVRAVHDAGARMTSLLPVHLFAPTAEPMRAERELAVPGGGQGMIEVSFTAVADPATGLMRQARRDIVTSIGADRRLTREDWTLVPQ